MVGGFWLNQDGLPLQFGTQKPIPEVGGDYLVYGETREIEQLIPLIPMQTGAGNPVVPAPPTSFVGTGLPSAAGIQSLTTLVPLQLTAPQTSAVGGNIVLTNTQLFFESVEVDTIIGATGSATSISVGLATQTTGPNAAFVQVTPQPGTQLLNAFLNARFTTAGQKTSFVVPGATTGLAWDASGTAVAGSNATWLGNVPLVTNAITPLPTSAWISTIQNGGTYTNGLLKLRLRYTMYGNIQQ